VQQFIKILHIWMYGIGTCMCCQEPHCIRTRFAPGTGSKTSKIGQRKLRNREKVEVRRQRTHHNINYNDVYKAYWINEIPVSQYKRWKHNLKQNLNTTFKFFSKTEVFMSVSRILTRIKWLRIWNEILFSDYTKVFLHTGTGTYFIITETL
jgi:hypothetical protein